MHELRSLQWLWIHDNERPEDYATIATKNTAHKTPASSHASQIPFVIPKSVVDMDTQMSERMTSVLASALKSVQKQGHLDSVNLNKKFNWKEHVMNQ